MDKQDLIYDVVCRLEEKFDKRMCDAEKDIADLKTFRARILAITGCITFICTLCIDFIKNLFHI